MFLNCWKFTPNSNIMSSVYSKGLCINFSNFKVTLFEGLDFIIQFKYFGYKFQYISEYILQLFLVGILERLECSINILLQTLLIIKLPPKTENF